MSRMEILHELVGFVLYAGCCFCVHQFTKKLFGKSLDKKITKLQIDDEDVIEKMTVKKIWLNCVVDIALYAVLIQIYHILMSM